MAEEMGFPQLLTIQPRQNFFLFIIETTGALNAIETIRSALTILRIWLLRLKIEVNRIV